MPRKKKAKFRREKNVDAKMRKAYCTTSSGFELKLEDGQNFIEI